MKSVHEINAGEFIWMQPHATQRAFELRAGEELLGGLRWNSSFGSLADAEAADGHWTFKRTGFFNPQITIRALQSETNVAVFTPNWKAEADLQFSDGACFHWQGVGFWRSQWAFTSDGGEPLVNMEPKTSFLKRSASVKATPAGLQTRELSLLILLGWYLLLLRSDDDAAAAAAICAAT